MNVMDSLAQGVIDGQADTVRRAVREALDLHVGPEEILKKGLMAGLSVIGERFKNGEAFIPEVLMAAQAMHAGMEVVEPLLVGAKVETLGEVVLGTVKGDIHDIGKNLVGIMLRGAGFKVTDLGVDVPPQRFVEAARGGARVIGMSALVSTTMPFMRSTMKALEEAGLKGKVKVLIGGAIVTQRYADEIGADGYAPDAASAVDKAKQLL